MNPAPSPESVKLCEKGFYFRSSMRKDCKESRKVLGEYIYFRTLPKIPLFVNPVRERCAFGATSVAYGDFSLTGSTMDISCQKADPYASFQSMSVNN